MTRRPEELNLDDYISWRDELVEALEGVSLSSQGFKNDVLRPGRDHNCWLWDMEHLEDSVEKADKARSKLYAFGEFSRPRSETGWPSPNYRACMCRCCFRRYFNH